MPGGIGTGCDPCPAVAGPTESADSDNDGIPDACDACVGPGASDQDGDGVCDEHDLCPVDPDADEQVDTDGDGVGDVCDNCPAVANPSQADADFDRIGDACDALSVGWEQVRLRWRREVLETPTSCPAGCDNCPLHDERRSGRQPTGDGVGDMCDNCPAAANADQADRRLRRHRRCV